MPLLRINAVPDGFALHSSPRPVASHLERLTPCSDPIVIMVHGFRYEPGDINHCPHGKIYSSGAKTGWPQSLAERGALTDDTLLIAFGWSARGRLRDVHSRSRSVGCSLARLITLCKHLCPKRAVHVIAHSLGSEVVCSALPDIREGALSRAVLLTGASHRGPTQTALSSPAGRTLEVINVSSRENDLYDLMFERLLPGDGAIGRGLTGRNVLNVQLDCPRTLGTLADFGHPIAASSHLLSHRSTYARDGAMSFYASLFASENALDITSLKHALPERQTPHFSKFVCGDGPHADVTALSLARRVKTRIMGALRPQGPQDEHAY